MKKLTHLYAVVISLFVLGAGCSTAVRSTPSLRVTASFYPLYFFTSQLTTTSTQITNLTPAGVEPHDFEPTARDVARIHDSDLIITNGLGFEVWMKNIGQELSLEDKIIVTSEGVEETVNEEESVDPHIWLSPVLAGQQVARIRDALVRADPAHRVDYVSRGEKLLADLKILDNDFKQGLSRCSRNTFITSHAAFGRLAHEYGLIQKSIAGLSPDAEPSARQLADLTKFAKNNRVNYIFFESLVSPKLAETLAKEVGAQTLVLNPLEGLTEEEMKQGKDYFSVMRENLKNLRIALDCT